MQGNLIYESVIRIKAIPSIVNKPYMLRSNGRSLTWRAVEVRRGGRSIVRLDAATQSGRLAGQVRVRGDPVRRRAPGSLPSLPAQHQPRRHAAVPILRTHQPVTLHPADNILKNAWDIFKAKWHVGIA